MQTPILTKKQLKSTLSAKKNRPKETLKNVLAVPYSTDYWPEILPQDYTTLNGVLIVHLPSIKVQKIDVHWDEIKQVPKEERKKYTRNTENQHGPNVEKKKHSVRIGVNEVSKLLEENSASAVLISADVQPRSMVQHILDQAVLYKVPVLVVDKLRQTLRKQCGVSGAVFAIEKTITDPNVNLIREHIESIFAKIPPPVNHINYNRSIDSAQVELTKEEKPVKRRENLKIDENEIRKNVYLKAPTSGRAFTPQEIEQPQKKIPRIEVDGSGFVPFFEEPEPAPTSRRAFIPQGIEKPQKKIPQIEMDETGFVPFFKEPEQAPTSRRALIPQGIEQPQKKIPLIEVDETGFVPFFKEPEQTPTSRRALIPQGIEQPQKKIPLIEVDETGFVPFFKEPEYAPTSGRAFIPQGIEQPQKKIPLIEVDETGFVPFFEEPSTSERAFIPPGIVQPQKKIPRLEVDETGFVPFFEEPENAPTRPSKQSYKSLVVKRLKGDRDRNKRKIERLKKKREM